MPIQIESHLGADSDVASPAKSPILGIDLGTTHSLVAVVQDGQPRVLSSREGSHLLPSIVSVVEGQVLIGYAAKKRKVRDASHTAFSVKRLLGRSYQDLKSLSGELPYELVPPEDTAGQSGMVRIRLGDRTFSAIEISALILKELKLSAEKELGCAVHRAVITVPAYFNDAQRQATRTAGRLAGLDVMRIVNEPTAASLAYGLDQKKQGQIAVYDLGGGTFDVSILKLHDGIFEVLSTNGDTALGGDDLDQAIAKVAAQEIRDQWGVDIYADPQVLASVLEVAENTKIALSKNPTAVFELNLSISTSAPAPVVYRKSWTIEEFERLARPILERTREPCLKALQDAGLQASDLSDVVLVGGPTRLQVVQDFVKGLFGREPNTSMHPDEVVAQGAAIQADILAGNNRNLLLLDVVPLSLGIETYGGVMSPLISRNTKIPTVAREGFTTFVDHQTGVDIHVLQGERDRVEDNRSLARFKLKGIQPMPAGMPRIEVTFLIDADGILQVAAKDLKTGNEQSIEVRPTYGLTDAEVESMLLAGLENADYDAAYRKWVESKNEAEPVLRAAEKNLAEAYRLLPEPEAQKISEAIFQLKAALSEKDAKKIKESTRHLNETTVRLAELLVKESLSASIQARNSIGKE